jgi:RNA processing factor Prp31
MMQNLLEKEIALLKKYPQSFLLGYKEITNVLGESMVSTQANAQANTQYDVQLKIKDLNNRIISEKALFEKAQDAINGLAFNERLLKESKLPRDLALTIFEETASKITSDFNLISSCVKSVEELDDNINKVSKRAQEFLFEFIPKKLVRQKNIASFLSELNTISFEEFKRLCKEEPLSKPLEREDFSLIISYSKSINSLFKLKEEILTFLKSKLEKISPNLLDLLGEVIASELISKAGSLEMLSRMPSSTIQLLGAENAFFRFLKSGGRNPKHGYIYNHPFVLNAKKRNQGKASRILANKISICAKVDFFGKQKMGERGAYPISKKIKKELLIFEEKL